MNDIKRTISNVLYSFGVISILILVAITIYGAYAFSKELNELLSKSLSLEELQSLPPNPAHDSIFWPTSYFSFMFPYVLNTFTMTMLAVGTFPMIIACIAVYKFNNIGINKYRFWKFNLIFLPVYICMISLLIVIFEMMMTVVFQYF
jgi:hypothetical protein